MLPKKTRPQLPSIKMSQYLLGIELSDSQLKIACLGKNAAGKFRVFGLDRIDIGVNDSEIVTDLEKWIAEKFPKESEFRAVLALPESSIFLKEIELPKMKDKQAREAIYWELSSVAPIPSAEAIYEWKVIERKENTIKVLAMVVRDRVIGRYLSIFRKAGIKVLAIEPFSVSLSRGSRAEFSKNTLLAVVQEQESNFVILKNKVPVFSTSLSVLLEGGKRQKKKLKKEVVAELSQGAKKILSFWKIKEEETIRQVIITGDIASKYFGLAKAINHFSHLPALVAKIKKFNKLVVAGQKEGELNRYLISYGAAARLLTDDVDEINLLPEDEKKVLLKERMKEDIGNKTVFFSKINLISFLVIFTMIAVFKIVNISLKRNIDQTNRFINNHPAQKLISEVVFTNQLLGNVEKLMAGQKDIGARLKLVAALTPENISFKTLNYSFTDKERWEISGKGNRDDILAFYGKLNEESGAGEVIMPYSNFNEEKDSEFLINLIW